MQERAARTRKRLVRAAAEAFDEHGLGAASMQAVSRSAGVSKGALYFHFPSKEHLADAVRAACGDRFTAAASHLTAAGESPVQVLMRLPGLTAEWLGEDVIVRVGLRLGREQQRRGERDHDGRYLHRELHDLLSRLLRSAAERREVRVGLPLETCSSLLVGFLFSLECRARESVPQEELVESIAELWSILLPGMAPVPEGG
ncbi:ScbR family autoregulator-binding transcription factor [Streptomyces sp. NPDC088097]|uniref:ScbR family autoregulator-binding transcription factor n=1 Tax=Streptomyces sp. NPDC088097 TaxID=3365823 RepID=UPI00382C66E0